MLWEAEVASERTGRYRVELDEGLLLPLPSSRRHWEVVEGSEWECVVGQRVLGLCEYWAVACE